MNYDEKASDYYSNIRKDIINLINPGQKGLKILEVGAAYGATLHYLKQSGIAGETVGIDLFEDTMNKPNYKPTDRFIFGNIEEIELSEYENYFDLILLPDVLEHLIEPKGALSKLKKCLKNDGNMIVSMPNIRHYSAFKQIYLKGDFRYQESGIFDYTHMRFYCRKNIQELIEVSGFSVVKQQSSIKNFEGKSITKTINLITFGLFEEFFSYQYFFMVRKK